jgi:rubrerythrin
MQKFGSVDEILDFAIGEEEAAEQFYRELAGQMGREAMREVFEGFADEEAGHKQRLQKVKKGQLLKPSAQKVADLKVADYVVEDEPNPEMDYQQAIILAMKKEKAAFRLYHDLAAATDNASLRDTLLALAQEEAKHKLRFEIEYDDMLD